MDIKTRLEKAKARLVKVKKMKAEIIFATEQIKTLEDGSIENSSALVKYRENFSMPAVKAKKMQAEIIFATEQIKALEDRSIENSSALVKYRENFSVPAVWIVRQGIRVANIPQIPAENIYGLNTYIQANTTKIDGGDLDAI